MLYGPRLALSRNETGLFFCTALYERPSQSIRLSVRHAAANKRFDKRSKREL